MKQNRWFLWMGLPLLLLLSACEENGLGLDAGGPVQSSAFFPLKAGNNWQYQSFENIDGTWQPYRRNSRRILENVTHEGVSGYLSVDSLNLDSEMPGRRYQLRNNQGGSHRVTTLMYAPPPDSSYGSWSILYKFDLDAEGSRWMEESNEDGTSYWELTETSASENVEAGTFANCIVNMWSTEGAGLVAERRHVFARGVGEVLEETKIWSNGVLMVHKRTELVSYSLE